MCVLAISFGKACATKQQQEFKLRKMSDGAANSPGCRSTHGETEQNTDPIPIRLNELKRRLPPLCNDSLQKTEL
jgi:hypothetical protein